LLGQVPLVTALREGGDTGAPIVVTEPESEAAQVFHAIAAQVEEIAPRKIYKKELRIT
jgi:ATP-binding protein involved in chromosome partitioning